MSPRQPRFDLSSRHPANILIVMTAIAAGILIVALCIHFVPAALLPAHPVQNTQTQPITIQEQQSINEDALNLSAAKTTAQTYLNAFLQGEYTKMWQLLAPDQQAMWHNSSVFTHYWSERFTDYTLHTYKLSKPLVLTSWTSPESMITYKEVIIFHVSLALQAKPVLLQEGNLPPEDLNPAPLFQNLPFVLEQLTTPNHTPVWKVLDGGPADLEAPILPPARAPKVQIKVPILMYHHVSNLVPRSLLDWSLTVPPDTFARQLDYLKERGYHTITFSQLFAALYYGAPLPGRPIILTFDDGYADAYKFVYPLLLKHHYSGMFYIITGKIGWTGQLTWSQMRQMLAHGMQMGSHTIHHVDMGQTLLYAPAQARQELRSSRQTLEAGLGIAIQQFCYPAGEPFRSGSLLQRQEIIAMLKEEGYVGATTDPGPTGIVQNSDEPFALLRTRIDGRASLQWFVKAFF